MGNNKSSQLPLTSHFVWKTQSNVFYIIMDKKGAFQKEAASFKIATIATMYKETLYQLLSIVVVSASSTRNCSL